MIELVLYSSAGKEHYYDVSFSVARSGDITIEDIYPAYNKSKNRIDPERFIDLTNKLIEKNEDKILRSVHHDNAF